MKLNLHKSILAATSLWAAGTTLVHATPETITSAPAVQLYIIGAAEEDQLLEQSIARVAKLDTATTSSLTEYISSDGNHRLYVFRSSSAAGTNAPSPFPASINDPNLGALTTGILSGSLPDNTIVAIHKYSAGGAIESSAPLNNTAPSTPVWIKAGLASAPAGTSAAVTVLTTVGASNTITFNKVTFSGTLTAAQTETRRPDIGLTTAEESQFVGRSSAAVTNPDGSGFPAFTVKSSDITNLTGVPTADLVNSIVVTKALRDALQKAQGLTSGSELEADVPSLTSGQINALFKSNYTDWTTFYTGTAATPLTSVVGVTLPANNGVYIVRRDGGSGNEIGTEGFFTKGEFTWTTSADAVTNGDSTSGLTSGTGLSSVPAVTAFPYVFSGTNSRANQDTFKALNTGNVWAIGLLSTEKPNLNTTTTATDRSNGYRFIKVDGYSPSLFNVSKGKYPIYNTTQLVYRTDWVTTLSVGTKYLVAAITRDLNNPSLLGPVDENLQINLATAGTTDDWGGGFLTSVPGTDNASGASYIPAVTLPTAATVLASPINPNTKQYSGSIDNQGPSVLEYPFLQ